jgi:lipopolysaccharide heptosyltransferase II
VYKIINRKKRVLTILADGLFNVITFPFRPFDKKNSPIRPDDIQQILLIRTAYIGDVIMTLPMLKPLKDRFPNASIVFLTSSGGREIVLDNPYVDDILVYEPFWFYNSSFLDYFKFLGQLRKRRFDLAIEARADIRDILFLVFPSRSKRKLSYSVGGGGCFLSHVVPFEKVKHKVEYHLDLARFLECDTSILNWGVYTTKAEKEEIEQLLAHSGISSPFICVHPGSRLHLKRWPLDRCASLYDRIIEETGLPLVVLGARSEIEIVKEVAALMKNRPVVLAGRTSIRQLYGVIARAQLLVCNDSAPMHMAAAAGTPTVAIFGPSKSIETGPYGNRFKVVENDFECRMHCDESVCSHRPYHECMQSIGPEEVYAAVKEILT